jgi:hypothetical protein
MSQTLQTPNLAQQATVSQLAAVAAAVNPMGRLAIIVRGIAADLLCASDTRIVKIAPENTTGWQVEIEVCAPNPELTASLHGSSKPILERSRHRLHFDADMQLVALEPAAE